MKLLGSLLFASAVKTEGCNTEEMAQWNESMMIWKADYHGKCICNEVKGLSHI